jgi:hypothetical protein
MSGDVVRSFEAGPSPNHWFKILNFGKKTFLAILVFQQPMCFIWRGPVYARLDMMAFEYRVRRQFSGAR